MTALDEQSVDRSFDVFRAGFQAALYASFADHLGRLHWDRTRIETVQRDRLRALLTVAKEQPPFHARRLARIDPATFELGDLPRLPVMSKAEMMAAFDDVTTDRRLTRAVAEETIGATTTVPRPIDGELLVLASGGSSGTRGLFAFDVAAFAEYAASILRPAMARRADAGDSPAASGPLVIVAAASAIHATGAAPPLLADPAGVRIGPRHPAARRDRRSPQRPPTRGAVRLPEHARPARRRAESRPPAHHPAIGQRQQRGALRDSPARHPRRVRRTAR
jgi:phenylacetate-CoA ligase